MDRLTLSFWTLRKPLTHPLMNYLNVSYMAMALVEDSEMDRFFSV